MKPITVISLDDHYLVRQGIRSLLDDERGIKFVGEGSAGEHLEPLIEQHQPDIILLDIGMPQKENITEAQPENSFRALPTIARLRRQHPDTNIIIVSQYASDALIEGALEMGVKGYLLKSDVLSTHLINAIRAVYLGGTYLSEGVNVKLHHKQSGSATDKLLTRRQREIIQAIVTNPNLSYAQLAERMGISEHTFSNHLRQIYDRLQVNNKTAAILEAVRIGIVSPNQLEIKR